MSYIGETRSTPKSPKGDPFHYPIFF